MGHVCTIDLVYVLGHVHTIQWRIQDFPEAGRQLSRGANIRFCQNFPKTAWNWKNLDPREASLAPPLDPPLPLTLFTGHLHHGSHLLHNPGSYRGWCSHNYPVCTKNLFAPFNVATTLEWDLKNIFLFCSGALHPQRATQWNFHYLSVHCIL